MTGANHQRLRRGGLAAAAAIVLFGSMGASCTPRVGTPFTFGGPTAPVVLTPTSTAQDIVAAINANTQRVQTYQATQASLTTPGVIGVPLLSSSIAVERPNRFRLRATTTITGPEVDLGSNDERFWVWARRNDPPGVYTATHDAFRSGAGRTALPIEPAWLVDALGLPLLDPAAAYEGPLPRGDGAVELRARVATPAGSVTRVYLVDDRTAQVREQHLFDETGSLAASVRADSFRYDPLAGVSLPEQVEVRVPAAQLALRINTGPVVLNAPIADGGQLWQMPQLNGYPVVDLGGAVPAAPGAINAFGLAPSGAPQPPPIAQQFGPATGVTQPTAIPSAPASAAYSRIPAAGVALDSVR